MTLRNAFRAALPLVLTLTLLGCSSGMMTYEQAESLKVGMTKQEVTRAYGEPSRINTTRTQGGVREQWVYTTPEQMAGLNAKPVYVYFENGTLSAVQY